VLERLAEDPPCEEGAGFEPAAGALGELPPPGLDAAASGELAGDGAAEGAGARDADFGDTGAGMDDKVSKESVPMGDRPA
jgi:hypothetical protein